VFSAAMRLDHDVRSWQTMVWGTLLLALDVVGLWKLALGLKGSVATIGADGVSVSGASRPRFVPYSMVERLELIETGVRLRLRGGGSLSLPVDPIVGRTLARRRLVFDRIREAMAIGEKRKDLVAKLEVLDRKGRVLVAWRQGLIGLLRSDGGYRDVPLDEQDLAYVVEDPRVAPERRIAAAVALSDHADPGIRRRVRLAIEACADDALRASLTCAAEGEIDENALGRAAESQRPVPPSA
jgi:hypothetical protein